MITTTIQNGAGDEISHVGTSGFTVTGIREGDGLDVLIEIGENVPKDEMAALVSTLLTFLEEECGESFVAACLAHYAEETGKQMMEAGDHKIAMIRSGSRGRKKR